MNVGEGEGEAFGFLARVMFMVMIRFKSRVMI